MFEILKKKSILGLGLFSILSFFSFLPNSYSKNLNNKIISTSDIWKPYAINDNSGLGVEILEEALKTQNLIIKHNSKPWKRALEDIVFKEADLILNIWKTQERESMFLFSKPYGINSLKFIKRYKHVFEYENLNSLNGKRIGIMHGYGYPNYFLKYKKIKLDETNSLKHNLKKLAISRIDLVLEDELVAKYTINEFSNKKFKDKFQIVKNPLITYFLYAGCLKENPNCNELLNKFNKGLELIKNNGKFEEIYQKYGIKAPKNLFERTSFCE